MDRRIWFHCCQAPGNGSFRYDHSIAGPRSSFELSFIKPVSQTHVAVGIQGQGILLFDMKSTKFITDVNTLSIGPSGSRQVRDISIYNDTLFAVTDQDIVIGTFNNSTWNLIKSIPVPHLKEAIASCIVRDVHNRIWIGTNQGLVVYNTLQEKFDIIQSDNLDPHSLKDNSINHLLIDNQNNLWISTSKLLQVASLNPSFFTSYTGASQGSDKMEHVYTLVAKIRMIYATGTDGLYEGICRRNKLKGWEALRVRTSITGESEEDLG